MSRSPLIVPKVAGNLAAMAHVPTPTTAFVLGGGGLRGAAEVGMLLALADAGIEPDVVVGTSIGSFNGAVVASMPMREATAQLDAAWDAIAHRRILNEGLLARAANLLRHRIHLHSNLSLRDMIREWIPVDRFEDTLVHFECVAACIETSSEHWFRAGSLADAILASCAVPGLLPPVEVDGLHFIDGGVVNSIPISRAVELGATEIYIMHVGHVDAALRMPRRAWDVAFVAFEVARRHRFHRDMEAMPDAVTAHVLPTGDLELQRYNDPAKLRYNHRTSIRRDIDRARRATGEYLSTRVG